jgi:hypothetical protein
MNTITTQICISATFVSENGTRLIVFGDTTFSFCFSIFHVGRRPSYGCTVLDAVFPDADPPHFARSPQSQRRQGLEGWWANQGTVPMGDARCLGVGHNERCWCRSERELFRQRSYDWARGMLFPPDLVTSLIDAFQIDWYTDFYYPFLHEWAVRVRATCPDKLFFVEGIPNEVSSTSLEA